MITTARISVTTTPTKLVDGPAIIFLQVESAGTVYLGNSTVTTATGYTVNARDGQFNIANHDSLYAIAASGTTVIGTLVFS